MKSRALKLGIAIKDVLSDCLNAEMVSKFFTSDLKTSKNLPEEQNSEV